MPSLIGTKMILRIARKDGTSILRHEVGRFQRQTLIKRQGLLPSSILCPRCRAANDTALECSRIHADRCVGLPCYPGSCETAKQRSLYNIVHEARGCHPTCQRGLSHDQVRVTRRLLFKPTCLSKHLKCRALIHHSGV